MIWSFSESYQQPTRLDDFSLEDRNTILAAIDYYGKQFQFPIKLELGPGQHGPSITDRVKLGLNPQADPGCEIFFDLNFGLPLPGESVSYIHSNQVLEHLNNIIFLFNEFWRVLIPGGTMEHCVPIYNGPHAWSDPTHRRAFTELSFRYFCVDANGEPFTAHFSDYGITSRFVLEKQDVRPGLDITAFFKKPA